MACNSGLALCLCGSPGQTDNGFTLRIIAPSISRVSCFKDLINLNNSQLPSGGSCRFEYCQAVNAIPVASENENWIRRKDALSELLVSKLEFATVPFQLVRNTLRGPRIVDYRIGTRPVATGVPTHQRSPGERLSSPVS